MKPLKTISCTLIALTFLAIGFGASFIRQSDKSEIAARRARENREIIFAEQILGSKVAQQRLQDQSLDRGQRNEAATALREHDLTTFLNEAAVILAAVNEAAVFKSWIVQHVGVAAQGMKPHEQIEWKKTLRALIQSEEAGTPMWREAIFALNEFPDHEGWIADHLESLSAADRSDNQDLLNEIQEPTRGLSNAL